MVEGDPWMQEHRERLAAVEVEIRGLTRDLSRTAEDVRCIRQSVHHLNDVVQTARGGWQAIVIGAGVAGALGGVIATVVGVFRGH